MIADLASFNTWSDDVKMEYLKLQTTAAEARKVEAEVQKNIALKETAAINLEIQRLRKDRSQLECKSLMNLSPT
jgi:hypothetical protein